MSERCPIDLAPEAGVQELPEICMQQCSELLENAEVDGAYDRYSTDKDCWADIEFSHSALYEIDENGGRRYVIVDACEEHDIEVGEQDYKFVCPYSKPNKIIN